MDINTYKKSVPYLFKAGITPLVWGYHGIGKSEIHQQIANDLGYLLFNFRLGQMADAGDILGIGELKRDAKGEAISTKFFMPNWLKTTIDFCEANPEKGAIIFLDEINRAARKDILQAIFELCLDKKLHETRLPENCYVVAAANPDTEDYNVLSFDDKAFISRFCHINLTPTKKEWIEYARATGHDDEVINFILEQPELLEAQMAQFNVDDVIKPCRRSWTSVSKIRKENPEAEIFRTLCQGLVGLNATVAFLKFMERDDKPLTAEEILKEYPKHAKKIQNLANPEKCRQDILKVCCTNLEDFIEKTEKKTLLKKEKENLAAFIKDVPIDLAYGTLQKIYIKPLCKEALQNDEGIFEICCKARGKTKEEANKMYEDLQKQIKDAEKDQKSE